MTTIPASQVPLYLPQRADSLIKVVYPGTNRDALTVWPYEARLLAQHELVSAVINKHGFLKYLTLLASIHAVRRVLRNISRSGLGIQAEDNYTVRRVSVPRGEHGGGVYFEPVFGRAEAFCGSEPPCRPQH